MSNPYSSGQQWDQQQILYGQQNLQLDPGFNPDSYQQQLRQQQQQQMNQSSHEQQQQLPAASQFQGPYHYPQQQAPSSNPHSSIHSSSLQGALQQSPQQASSHSRSSSYTNFSPTHYNNHMGGGYGVQGGAPVNQAPPAPYRANNTQTFTFGTTNLPAPLAMDAPDATIPGGAFMTTSPQAIQDTYTLPNPKSQTRPNQRTSSQPTTKSTQPSAKRQRPNSHDDANDEDIDAQNDPSDDKDPNKAKP